MNRSIIMQAENSDIWDSFSRGDEKGLKIMYETYYDVLVNYGYKFTSHLTTIEEAIQSLFLKMWKNRSGLNKPHSLKHYLLKAFRHTLFSHLQSESRLARIKSFQYSSFHPAPPPDEKIVSMEEADRQRQLLSKRMNALTNRQKEAIYLRFYQELSYQEIASLLKMNTGGVYKLIYRAIERLRTEN